MSLVGPDDADDICQHVALRAFQHESGFKDHEHARAWALHVAKNACRDVFRKRKRGREVSLDDDAFCESLCPYAAFVDRHQRDPESALISKEEDRRLRICLRTLPPRLRDAAVLHFLDEQPHARVAVALRITPANARKRIQNARSLLRRAIHNRTPADV